MKKLLLAGCVLSALVSPAWAADPVAPAYDWTGFYAGIQGGYAFGDASHSFSNGAPADNSDPQGWFGGVHMGYNIQADAVVFGVEVDGELTGIDGSFDNTTGATSSGSTDINMQGSLRARLGLPMDRMLPYLTGGLAVADVDYGGGPSGGPCCGYSETPLGYTIGAGLEFAMSETMSARVEYRFTDFGKETGGLAPTFPNVDMPVDLEVHAIRLGVSWQF